MNSLRSTYKYLAELLKKMNKPFAIILAGHNGSGKSTMWYKYLSSELQIPLINADRMMLSILPEAKRFPEWAKHIRDKHEGWMKVAQKGVDTFIAQAIQNKVSFARETVFSHWKRNESGEFDSKIDEIRKLKKEGYHVLLIFVGLTSSLLSIARVQTRVENSGHAVALEKLEKRFSRTQEAIKHAVKEANASILVDNSRSKRTAFKVCRIQNPYKVFFDLRKNKHNKSIPNEIKTWLDKVCPDCDC